MVDVVLQAGADLSSLELLSLAANVAKAAVGLTIAYIAYRGYRRNRSRPMFFLSLGFVLVLGLPFVILLVDLFAPQVSLLGLVVVSETSQLLGLLLILYALWMEP